MVHVTRQEHVCFITAKNNFLHSEKQQRQHQQQHLQQRNTTQNSDRARKKKKQNSLTSHCCCVVLCWWCSQVNREKEEAKKSLSPPSCIRLLWSSSCVCCVWRVYQHSLRKYEQLIILSNTRPHIILCVYHTSIHTYEYIRHTSCFIFIFLRIW